MIKQAVIPAAGLGTRFLPVTKNTPKELVPLYNKPCLDHVIDEAVAAGVEEFIIVVSDQKPLIESYYSPNPFLEHWLEKRGKTEQLKKLKHIHERASFKFVMQNEPLGLGHAVLCAKDHINSENFFVLLPDDLFISEVPVCQQMVQAFEHIKTPILSVMEVEWDNVHRYGIVDAKPLGEKLGEVNALVEKPHRDQAPSNLAVIGRYILPKEVFGYLETTKPGAGGEIQLTDALVEVIGDHGLSSYSFEGERYDTGTPMGWLEANLNFALNDPESKDATRQLIKNLAVTL